MSKAEKQLIEREKRGHRKMLSDWGAFLNRAGLKVKFHKHGGFSVKPPDFKTITEARKGT